MIKAKFLLLILTMIILSGCAASTAEGNPTAISQNNPYPASQTTQSAVAGTTIPYPIITPTQFSENSAYPEPGGGTSPSNIDSKYLVDQLTVEKPGNGNGAVTGQLLDGGDETQPYLTTLYLASTTSANSADQQPVVNFSIKNDPIATEEISTGRFLFTDITPGQYALVVSTGAETFIILDGSGKTLLLDVKSNEITDLGVIPVR